MSAEEEAFVKIDDVANHFNVSAYTVKTWIRKGLLPETAYIRLPKMIRFKLKEVEKALVAVQQEEKPKAEEKPVDDFVLDPVDENGDTTNDW